MARQDNRGRKLKEGESHRKDGRYSFRYTDERTGKRKYIYAQTLTELREKEKKLQADLADNITTEIKFKQMNINTLFDHYKYSF